MIHFVLLSDLEADLEVKITQEWGKWRYVDPPRIIFVPSAAPPFLPGDSNIRAPIPRKKHGHT